jgi:surfeit locus 1 family protein
MTELLKPRWLLVHLLIAAICVVFVLLGMWQLRRHQERQANNALLAERLMLAPRPLGELLNTYRIDLPEDNPSSIAHRPASVTGHYDPAYELLYRIDSSYDGQPGYLVLTPLILDDETAVLVKRGWVPAQMNTPPVSDAPPPTGEVTLTGSTEYERPEYRGALAALVPRDPPGELDITAYIDTARLSQQMPYTLLPVFLELREQTPPHPEAYPLPLKAPEFEMGSHLGYAIQWFGFLAITLIGYGFILKNWLRDRQRTSAMS